MSLSIAYETVEEATMRLSHTVVMYDGEPVYVSNVARVGPDDPKEDVFRVFVSPLPYTGDEANVQRKFISSKKFDLKTIPLGFMNRNNTVYLLSRNPARQYKQGLSGNSLLCVPLIPGIGGGFGFGRLIQDTAFVDTIKGIYPSFEEALAELDKGKKTAVAFARQFAVSQEDPAKVDEVFEGMRYLWYRTNKIGVVFGPNEIKLAKNALCFKEPLGELGVRV